jgi:hypothetical protein
VLQKAAKDARVYRADLEFGVQGDGGLFHFTLPWLIS